ncbi:UNVERIFIED_CONTAM: hypothetical protein FKN15_060161 [Acipenser sinensis]
MYSINYTQSIYAVPIKDLKGNLEDQDEQSDIEEGGLNLNVPFKPISAYVTDKQELLEQCFRVIGEKKLMKMLPDELKDLKGNLEDQDEQSDIEEGGLNLNVPFKPISAYVTDKQELLEQCFRVIGEKKLMKMLPDELKSCTCDEIKQLCMEQLQQLSQKNLLHILEVYRGEGALLHQTPAQQFAAAGDLVETFCSSSTCVVDTDLLRWFMKKHSEVIALNTSCKAGPGCRVTTRRASNGDCGLTIRGVQPVDAGVYYCAEYSSNALEFSNGSLLTVRGGASGEESDALSINADAYDSDIEGHKEETEEKKTVEVVESPVMNPPNSKKKLQSDIEKSVNEILALGGPSPEEPKVAALAAAATEVVVVGAALSGPASEGVQPSAQQLELLELEMRARAIKALMKANEVKKQACG